MESPPPRSSEAEEHGGRSEIDESALPSAPAWTDRNQSNSVFRCEKDLEDSEKKM